MLAIANLVLYLFMAFVLLVLQIFSLGARHFNVILLCLFMTGDNLFYWLGFRLPCYLNYCGFFTFLAHIPQFPEILSGYILQAVINLF